MKPDGDWLTRIAKLLCLLSFLASMLFIVVREGASVETELWLSRLATTLLLLLIGLWPERRR